MQSQLVQYGLNNNGIQFQSVQEQYPLGESVYVYFVVPGGVQYQHQQGDYVAVLPVGWRNVSELVGQKVINVENIWGNGEQGFGHVVFESHILPTIGQQQQYQFVYVRNGGLVQGMSRPFTFVPVNGVYGQQFVGQQCGQQQFVGQQCGQQQFVGQQWGQQQQFVGQRLYGIQQWINRLRQVIYGQQGINGVEQYQYEPYHIQYQHGLKFLQRGLEQVLLNELEGVKCLQQGLQHIQQYVQLNQVLPQLFHQEIRRIQQSVHGLEQFYTTYRPQQQIGESSIYRQHVQTIQQGLQQLRTIVPVPFTVLSQEPTVLRQKIQEIFSSLPIESTWGQQSFHELIYTVGRFLIEHEKVEQVQRQLEQERIIYQLRTLGQVLLGQQQGQQRVVIGQRLNQLLREILQQVTYLRQREQLHLGSTGQRLAQLVQQFEGRQIVDLQQLRQYVLDLVCGQVSAQVGLRGYYRDLAGLLDEIQMHFGEYLFSHLQHLQQTIQTPSEYRWWSQQTPFGLESELYTPTVGTQSSVVYPTVGTQSTTGVYPTIGIQSTTGVYPTIQQLRNRFQELRSVRLGLTGLTGLTGGLNGLVGECENVFGQVRGGVLSGVRGGLFEQQQQYQQGEPICLEQVVLRGDRQTRSVLNTVVPQIGSFQQQCNRLNF